jgi:hypothetical protein
MSMQQNLCYYDIVNKDSEYVSLLLLAMMNSKPHHLEAHVGSGTAARYACDSRTE